MWGGPDLNDLVSSSVGVITSTDVNRVGPRFAGTLQYQLPFKVGGMPPVVSQGATRDLNGDGRNDDSSKDSDGDGLVDLFDNCPNIANLDWLDTDNNGTGETCE